MMGDGRAGSDLAEFGLQASSLKDFTPLIDTGWRRSWGKGMEGRGKGAKAAFTSSPPGEEWEGGRHDRASCLHVFPAAWPQLPLNPLSQRSFQVPSPFGIPVRAEGRLDLAVRAQPITVRRVLPAPRTRRCEAQHSRVAGISIQKPEIPDSLTFVSPPQLCL